MQRRVNEEQNTLWRSNRTKEKGLGFWGGKLWEGTYMGKLLEDQGWLVRVICADPSLCQLSVSSDNGSSPPLGTGKGMGDRKRESRKLFLYLLSMIQFFELPSAQNNPYANVPSFVGARVDPLH